jgi:sporadic carbohydrate cluster 2OG-Fe(II) oxygenase
MKNYKNLEKIISRNFINKGYVILPAQNLKILQIIKKKIEKFITKNHKINIGKKITLNSIHKYINKEKLNDIRLSIINFINQDKNFKNYYFRIAKDYLSILVGNDLVMQKNINLSIQLPKDNSSLLPIHSDVWSGDSQFEINLWVPLVNCYKTKSMYILEQNNYLYFTKIIKDRKINDSQNLFEILKNKLKWLKVDYGDILIFNQNLPHGNIVNLEKETRWSMNCRFKNIFSPYGDKKLGEFFFPIDTRPMTELALEYDSPF